MPDLFCSDEHTPSVKLACLERELKMRESVYPRWVEKGKMTAQKAEIETAVMRAIVEDYRKLVRAQAQG